MGNAVAVTGESFQTEVLQSKLPVLVDFWAAWCGPCRAIAPAIEEIANEYAGRLKVVKLDTEESQDVAIQYNVTGIPTLILFKDGQVVERLLGAHPKPVVISKIERHL
jgi:thioredoxin